MGNADRKENSGKYLIALLLLVLFHAVANYAILSRDNTPLLWDGGEYFCKSLKYFNVFRDMGPGFFSRFNEVSHYRPPLFMLTSLPLYALFGRSTDVAAMTNILYLAILVFSVYGIGSLMQGRDAGLAGAFLVSFFPIMFGMSRSYWLDFPLVAMVSLGMYLLLRSDGFQDGKYSVLFGISFGLGMLTKWIHFVFLAGPVLYFLASSMRNDERRPRFLRNAAIAFLAAAAVASFWYVPNGKSVAVNLLGLSVGVTGEEATRFQQLGESFGPTGIFNLPSLTYYAGKYVNDQAGFVFAAISLAFAVFLAGRWRERDFWILLLWIAIPVVAFTLIKNKTPRNTVSILPAAALLISIGIMKIERKTARISVLAGVVLFASIQYASSSFGLPFLPDRVAVKTSLGGDIVFFERHRNSSHALFSANRGEWKAEEILKAVDQDRGEKKNVGIVLLPRDAFNWMSMEYTSLLNDLPFGFIGAVNDPDAVLSCDYLLVKKGGFVAPWFLMPNVHKALDLMEDNGDRFVLLKSIVLPEQRSTLPLYDVTATRKGRKSGVVFDGKFEVVDYLVTESAKGENKVFDISLTLRGLGEIRSEIREYAVVINKRNDAIFRKALAAAPPINGIRPGETKTVTASLEVPKKAADRFYGFEVGFSEYPSGRELEYSPEYLVYRRAGR